MEKSEMIPFEMRGTKREFLFYRIGEHAKRLGMVDFFNHALTLNDEKYLDEAFGIWFEYYGVGE